MPNLQLKDDEAADIAAWLLSIEGAWIDDPKQPDLDEKTLDDLITLFLQKSMTLKKTKEALASGVPEADAKEMKGDEKILVAPISKEKKLTYLGKKTISRMGCFGCHDIPGFETAKPIGTELASWGLKARMDPDKLDFAHITEYLHNHATEKDHSDPDFHLFSDGMAHHKGESFLWQKLRDPRSYDFDKLKAWDDKLRMPRFPFADNPADVEAVMTFILGLVADDQIPQHYRNVPKAGPKFAKIEGEKALEKFNCRGCHITQMSEFTFDLGKFELPDPSVQHGTDFPDTARDQAAMPQFPQPKVGKLATISGIHVGTDEATDDMAFDVWVPTVIDGKQFFIGDRLVVPADAVVKNKGRAADGGQFAELLVSHLMKTMNKSLPNEVWGFVPPPLVREGMKAQPAWLHQFLLNPSELRPAVRLRMPRFNMTSEEAGSLAGYFAAVDGMEYPYEHVRDRDDVYLSQKESQHPNYLRDGWRLLTMVPDAKSGVTDKLCASCHNVGNRLAGGEPEGRGPNLYLAPDRLRSDWLRQWITTPKRILPFTAMPNNFALQPQRYQEQFPGTSQEQIIGVRDALMNYQKVQASELATQAQAQPSTGGN
jgi:mono/diheme cytochrome c family protein